MAAQSAEKFPRIWALLDRQSSRGRVTGVTRSRAMKESYAEWVTRRIRQAREGGGDIVTLFNSSTPEPVALLRDIVLAAFQDGMPPTYATTMGGGNRLVRALLAERYGVAPGQVCCATGASAALMLLLKVLVRPGDDVLVETPGFDLFSLFVADRGAHVVPFPRTGEGYDIDPERVERALTPKTRLIIASNLHNPSGFPISRQSVEALAGIAERHGVYVLVDEVYRDYLAGPDRVPAAVTLSPRMISVSSMTKIWGLSTLRCGWIVGAPDLMARVNDWASTFDFGLSNLTHALAACVLRQADRFDAFAQAQARAFGETFSGFFDDWKREGLVEGRVPDFGCIRFLALAGIEDTLRFSDRLAETEGVIVAPGEFFGAPGHVRLGFASDPARLIAGLERFSRGLRAYRRTT